MGSPANNDDSPNNFARRVLFSIPQLPDFPICIPSTLNSIPPWINLETVIDLNLSKTITELSNSQVFKPSYLEATSKYPDHIKIFTDGSKTTEFTSFGLYIPTCNVENSYKIHPANSICSAEAAAICKALFLPPYDNKGILILSDSLSVLQAVSNPNHRNHYIQEIQRYIVKNRDHIVLMWIPSYMGQQS